MAKLKPNLQRKKHKVSPEHSLKKQHYNDQLKFSNKTAITETVLSINQYLNQTFLTLRFIKGIPESRTHVSTPDSMLPSKYVFIKKPKTLVQNLNMNYCSRQISNSPRIQRFNELHNFPSLIKPVIKQTSTWPWNGRFCPPFLTKLEAFQHHDEHEVHARMFKYSYHGRLGPKNIQKPFGLIPWNFHKSDGLFSKNIRFYGQDPRKSHSSLCV